MASYEEQQEHLRRLMEEVPTNEEARKDDSDTEQDISDGEAEDRSLNELCFIGKDKATKWMKQVPTKTVRTRKEDKVLRSPISRLATRTLNTPIEILKYFINDEMVDLIVQHTNAYIDSVSDNFERERDARSTNITEIHSLLGLLFYAGVLKANHLNLEELWKSDGSEVEIYSPSENVTIDEKLEGLRGRCSFRQYIPSKPNKYRIKIFALSDAKMYYTMNLEVYVGQPDGPYKVTNSPNCIVERLCDPIKGSGRNLTINNWFTSIPLVEKLYKDYTLMVTGTIPCDLIPPHLRIRVAKENNPRQLKNRLREICGIQDIPGLLNRNREGQTGRCSVCSSKRNRKNSLLSPKMCQIHLLRTHSGCMWTASRILQVPIETLS
ncbi:hypothetical protein NQ314_020616 [Rhamnusium bicolor]|uniref:PiggyBac transposable element-derived protein domain-containing protein n=1 Tax=Rhamnusium bicolor TaxID=1586634 RepID=A0AAV8WL79_9CUCU|nr:hypothetical protein NQ314_020616 [Rhamnusium bicolor]